LLLLSYSTTGWNDSTVLAICNVSVVLLAAIIGFLGFKENFNKLKIIGLTASIAAIVLLYLASLK
jgi:multidrug transporter EmrE-like cation transporter